MNNTVSFDDQFGEDFDTGGIWFHAFYHDDEIYCLISRKALQYLAGSSAINFKDTFLRHRERIRQIAIKLILAEQFEDGKIIITQAHTGAG